MLKPVSILALDATAATLAEAVQKRVTADVGIEDLVQVRTIASAAGDGTNGEARLPSLPELADAMESIHERRQAPDSPLRNRADVSSRELILLMLSAAGPGRAILFNLARQLRQLYQMRMARELYTIEVLCLLPDLFASTPEDYGAAYSVLKLAAAAMTDDRDEGTQKPLDAMWLVSSTNAHRVKFGRLDGTTTYVQAVAGVITFEPELSGSLPGAFRPRGMAAAFSSFGYAELLFPRQAAAQRMESRLAAELLRDCLLTSAELSPEIPQTWAKAFVVGPEFAPRVSRLEESGRSFWKEFRAKTAVTERTRSAQEVITAVANEEKTYRDTQQVAALQELAMSGDETARAFAELLSDAVDEKLDQYGYPVAMRFVEALLDPIPDLQPYATPGAQNIAIRIREATRLLDQRLKFAPNETESEAMRKRYRDLDAVLSDQKLASDGLAALDVQEEEDADAHAVRAQLEAAAAARAGELAEMRRERNDIFVKLPNVIFKEEGANSAARNAAKDDLAAALAGATAEQQERLRSLFAEKPNAERAWHDALEVRDQFVKRHVLRVLFALVSVVAVPAIGYLVNIPGLRETAVWLLANRGRAVLAIVIALVVYGLYAAVRYVSDVAPALDKALEWLRRLKAETTPEALSRAVNAQLQFEYDVAHRRTVVSVLKRTRDVARKILEEMRVRSKEIEALAARFAAVRQSAPIASAGLSVSIIDDGDVDRFYDQTADDRKPVFSQFSARCLTRSASRKLPVAELETRIASYAGDAFESFRNLTLAQIACGAVRMVDDAAIAQRLKRLAEFSAPLVEVRDDDVVAQQAMQQDTTLWLDDSNSAFVGLVRKWMPNGEIKPARDPLRIHALSRVLHFPAYVVGQIEYYRAQYDPAAHLDSADAPDLLPPELVLTPPVRAAYEQILLGRAVGVIRLRDDGQFSRASDDMVLGDSHLQVAERLAASDSAALRRDLELEIEPRLGLVQDVERGLRALLADRATSFDRNVIGSLLRRYGLAFP